METTSLSYFRLDTSPYFKSDFLNKEQEMFQSLGIKKALDPFSSEILISNTHTDFQKLPLEKLKASLLLHPNSGYDNFPISFVKEASFPILTGNTIRAHAVAEYTLSAVFDHFCSIPKTKNWDSKRTWERALLSEQTVFLLGYGHIGKILEQSLKPLVKKLIIHDPFKDIFNPDPSGANILLLASSLNKTSAKIIDKAFLNKLAPDWLLVNGARGGLIQQEDLIQALKKNQNSKAYLDVFHKEPVDFKEFEGLDNLKLSSHIAGVSKNLDALMLDFERECASKFITHRSNLAIFEGDFKELLLRNKLSTDISFLI